MTRQDGPDSDVVVIPLGRGVYRLSDGSRTRLAYATTAGSVCWVFVDGQVFKVDDALGAVGRPRPEAGPGAAVRPISTPKRTRGEHPSDLAAPMPATVVDLAVTPGQRVSRGDVLVRLEAMKMELPIKAPRDGVVKAIACRPGELVQPGVPLLELE